MNAMGGKNMEQEIKVGSRVRLKRDSPWAKNGTVGTVVARDGKGFIIRTDSRVGITRIFKEYGIPEHYGMWKPTEWIELLPDASAAPSPAWSIHITPKGNATHAVFKQGKHLTGHASAFCSPRDTYDPSTGAAWAFLRLPGMADAARRVLAEMDGVKVPAQEQTKKRGMAFKECKVGMKVRFIGDDKYVKSLRKYPSVGTVGEIVENPYRDGTAYVQWPKGSTFLDDCWWVKPDMLEPADVADEPAPVPQAEYKPGDRVRIVDKWVQGCNQAPKGEMDKWLGKTMTVRGEEKLHESVMWYKMVEDKKDYRGNDTPGWNWWPAAIAGKVGESRKEK